MKIRKFSPKLLNIDMDLLNMQIEGINKSNMSSFHKDGLNNMLEELRESFINKGADFAVMCFQGLRRNHAERLIDEDR